MISGKRSHLGGVRKTKQHTVLLFFFLTESKEVRLVEAVLHLLVILDAHFWAPAEFSRANCF